MSQGKTTVETIDDKEDMQVFPKFDKEYFYLYSKCSQFADEAFDILGFTHDEKYEVFKNTACMMHMGNMTKDFVPVGKEEQAEVKNDSNAVKVAELAGIDCEWMINYFWSDKQANFSL